MSETASWKWKILCWLADRMGPPPETATLAQAREALSKNANTPLLSGRHPTFATVQDEVIAGVNVRRYRPVGAKPGRVVYFHGGGWVSGGLDSHDSPARGLAVATEREVVSVDYRLAPEHLYPAAFDDSLAVTRALAGSEPVVVAGDSAGGNLAAVVANRCAKDDVRLAAQVLVYPVTDCATDTASYARYTKDHMLTAERMRYFWRTYVPDEARRNEPDVSPLRAASVKGVAPAYVLLARCDVLHDEGVAYAKKLERDGVETVLDVVPGAVHGFFSLQGMSEAKGATKRIAAWLTPRW